MMEYELGLEEPDPRQAPKSALIIAGAYAVGALVPLSAYLFTATPQLGLLWSALIALGCLLAFGCFRSRLTGQLRARAHLRVAATPASQHRPAQPNAKARCHASQNRAHSCCLRGALLFAVPLVRWPTDTGRLINKLLGLGGAAPVRFETLGKLGALLWPVVLVGHWAL